MNVVYALERPPETFSRSLFLAGPSPRADSSVGSWRPEALERLERMGYDGVVFVPEPREGAWDAFDYEEQILWEEECLGLSDVIVFWVPRDLTTRPALTTNDEWGTWKRSGKCVWGSPPSATKVSYQRFYAERLGVPARETLADTLSAALERLGQGASRRGGERGVPLFIWRSAPFQDWYAKHRAVGNRLERAWLEWTFRPDASAPLFSWILHVEIHVAAEGRVKSNEFVFFRPDVSSTLLYYPGPSLEETRVVLVREFRSAVANSEARVRELPGGSQGQEMGEPRTVAAEELEEETGLRLAAERFVAHPERQEVSTLSSHRAHLFSARLTLSEMDDIAALVGTVRGREGDSERTYLDVATVGELLGDPSVDWSTLGMVLSVLAATPPESRTIPANDPRSLLAREPGPRYRGETLESCLSLRHVLHRHPLLWQPGLVGRPHDSLCAIGKSGVRDPPSG